MYKFLGGTGTFPKDGKWIAAAGHHEIMIRDLANGQYSHDLRLPTFHGQSLTDVSVMAFSICNRFLTAGSSEGWLAAWDLPTPLTPLHKRWKLAPNGHIILPERKGVLAIVFSPDSSLVAAGIGEPEVLNEILIWAREEGTIIKHICHGDYGHRC